MSVAPIVVFAFRRPDHLGRCLASLAANVGAEMHDLVIYCDHARDPAHREGIEATRAVARQASGFASVQVIERDENFGLARSIITGVSDVLARHDSAIVIEDDLVLSPYFLQYMRDALEGYADDALVASIVGYAYPVEERLPETYFVRGTDCLGWATWRRAWNTFEQDGAVLYEALIKTGQRRAFDRDGTYPYTRLLQQQNRGGVSSWAVRWHASCFIKSMVSLFPAESLVLHAGDDALATTSADTGWLNGPIAQRRIHVHRQQPVESPAARAALARFFRKNRNGFAERARGWIRRRLSRLGLR